MNEPVQKPKPTSFMLTRDDVERLMKDDSPESRSAVLEKVAVQYNSDQLQDKEAQVAEHIFRLLMRDTASRVRATLAERMQDNTQVPRDIVLHLASDVAAVAAPLLRHSPVLSDADLVGIIESSKEVDKLVAITQRDKVSERVSGALVETRYAEVVSSLLNNSSAKISAAHLTQIVDDHPDQPDIIGALSTYPHLPAVTVQRLIKQASVQVADELKKKYNLTDAEMTEEATSAREALLLKLLDGELPSGEMEDLVASMARDGSLTPSVMMTALCRGQAMFFTMAMARMADVPLPNAIKLVSDRGDLGFNALYGRSGLPEMMMQAMLLVLRSVQDLESEQNIVGSVLYANRLMERVLMYVGEQNIEYIPYFIALIRQHAQRK